MAKLTKASALAMKSCAFAPIVHVKNTSFRRKSTMTASTCFIYSPFSESRGDPNTEVVDLAEVERVVVCAVAAYGVLHLAVHSALHLAATHLG